MAASPLQHVAEPYLDGATVELVVIAGPQELGDRVLAAVVKQLVGKVDKRDGTESRPVGLRTAPSASEDVARRELVLGLTSAMPIKNRNAQLTAQARQTKPGGD